MMKLVNMYRAELEYLSGKYGRTHFVYVYDKTASMFSALSYTLFFYNPLTIDNIAYPRKNVLSTARIIYVYINIDSPQYHI